MPYNAQKAIDYAHTWAYKRNPRYLSFDGIGGDCTNFVSQCLYAGTGTMNHTKTFGWYYYSAYDRTPSWTGVGYLYQFLLNNKGPGPQGTLTVLEQITPGDIIQLSQVPGQFTHSLFVVDTGQNKTLDEILIATHSLDSDYRPLSTYQVLERRYIKIGAK